MSSDLTNANLFLTTALLVLVLGVTQTNGVQTHVCTMFDRSHHRGICGSILADVVQYVCRHYAQRHKRDTMSEPVDSLADISLNKPNALSFLSKRQNIPGMNINCECCMNRCNAIEMLDYCHYI
ncbi:molluscan insulin-related peptide 3-like [Biomphalaria glabrata]|uniref:Molluscan insulin-related peptide 3-like n=1 Tax=Biomphalaria glabrata TaxID=6526 RepID=A0A9W3ALE8_BIOGL|nr:molluscan insulin-related peptide 3-like [Biomphalaria glabrata]